MSQAKDISGFTLKVLAILGMTANHVAYVFSSVLSWQVAVVLYAFGGMTYPIMAFLLVEGYRHTSDVRRYAARLATFAVIAQVPYTLCFGLTLNVLFTLLIGLLVLWCWDNLSRGVFAVLFVVCLTISCLCDWAVLGPLMAFSFYYLRDRGMVGIWLTLLPAYACLLIPVLFQLLQVSMGLGEGNTLSQVVTGVPLASSNEHTLALREIGYALVGFTIAALLIRRYHGRRGYPMKWFFYTYYPLHLLVIWGAHQAFLLL